MNIAVNYRWLLILGLTLSPLTTLAVPRGGEPLYQDHTPDWKGTPRDYENRVRSLFKQGKWDEGKKVCTEGLDKYESSAALNRLMGSYWMHYSQLDRARYYLIRSLREDGRDPETLRMLMKVEEQAQHYSSAIVYCNKMLELAPYDYGLWRKKIALFREQGNEEEASRLLKRLREMYPEREEVKKEIAGDYDTRYRSYRKKNNLAGQEAMLRQLVNIVPKNAEYQMALVNLLIRTGRMEDAIDVAGHAATVVANPYPFVVKKASILGDMTRYNEALSYIKGAEKTIPGLASSRSRLTSLSNELEREQARTAARNDPYTAYGRLYEKEHSEEALNYLLNTSMSRGYLDDALTYIREARRRRGDTQNLLYREYTVQRRLGNTKAAMAMLEKIHARWPNNVETNEELCAMQMEEVRRMMDFQQWDEAATLLEKMSAYRLDPDSHDAVVRRLFTCYVSGGNRQKALSQLDKVSDDPKTRAGLYEEVMMPYIKQLIRQGMTLRAEEEIRKVLDKGYPSADILSMAISTELVLKHDNEARELVEQGKKLYPDAPYFQIKDAQLTASAGSYYKAYDMLNNMLDVYVGDTAVMKAYAECCEVLAQNAIKSGDYNKALFLIFRGLEVDPTNQSLILAKSTAYEKKKEWANAIEAYRLYHPGFGELSEYHQRMQRLRRHLMRNQIVAYYQCARPSNEDNLTSQASMTYSRILDRNTYTLGLVYVGRDGFTHATDSTDVGGHGIQVNGEWQHLWGQRLTTTLSAGVATKFLPRIRLGLGASYAFDRGWTGTGDLSYRRMEDDEKASLFGASLGVTKEWDVFSLSATGHAFYMTGEAAKSFNPDIFFNGGLTARCYPIEGNRSYLYVTGSVGNAPELSLIDNSMPVRFDQLNAMLGGGALFVVNTMMDLGLSGTWYNMQVSNSGNSSVSRSRNYLYLGAYVIIHF
jgi:YaiO family outer membrane protein